jgi:hypothetical protein
MIPEGGEESLNEVHGDILLVQPSYQPGPVQGNRGRYSLLRIRGMVVVSSAIECRPGIDYTKIEENRDNGQLFAALLIKHDQRVNQIWKQRSRF